MATAGCEARALPDAAAHQELREFTCQYVSPEFREEHSATLRIELRMVHGIASVKMPNLLRYDHAMQRGELICSQEEIDTGCSLSPRRQLRCARPKSPKKAAFHRK